VGFRNCRVPDTRCSAKLTRGGLDGLVHGLSCVATDFAERRDAKFKGEFVAKYVPESTVSVETGRRKAGAEKSLLIFDFCVVY